MRYRIVFATVLLSLPFAAATDTRPGLNTEQFAAKIAWQQQQEPEIYSRFRKALLQAWHSDDDLKALMSSEVDDLDKLVGFLGFIRKDHGALTDLQFKYFDTLKQRRSPRPLAVYHTVFERGSWWALRVGLDESGLVNTLILTDPNYNQVLPELTSSKQFELPFVKGEQWYVLWGGTTEEMNYHVSSRSQRKALDLLIRHPFSGQSYKGNGETNKDYYAFNREVLAPVNGKVVKVIDGVNDNPPGQMNPKQLTGNTIVIRVSAEEYLLLAHLRNGSIKVQEGDTVSVGEPLGLVGNSGNSSEPHLHMHLMSGPAMKDATGIEIRFRQLAVHGDSLVNNYAPVRSDVIGRL